MASNQDAFLSLAKHLVYTATFYPSPTQGVFLFALTYVVRLVVSGLVALQLGLAAVKLVLIIFVDL